MAEDVLRFKPEIEIICPFCGLSAQAGEDDKGDPAIIHKMPPCQMFLDHEVDEYLYFARKEIERKTKENPGLVMVTAPSPGFTSKTN